jgi:hypothetical protein
MYLSYYSYRFKFNDKYLDISMKLHVQVTFNNDIIVFFLLFSSQTVFHDSPLNKQKMKVGMG